VATAIFCILSVRVLAAALLTGGMHSLQDMLAGGVRHAHDMACQHRTLINAARYHS
jgi:hypothetical protein